MTSNNSRAQNVMYLPEGIKSPYTGVLFPVSIAQKMQVDLLQLDQYKELSLDYEKDKVLYQNNIQYEEKKVNVLLDQNDKLMSQVEKSSSMSSFEKIIYFGLGIIATVSAGVAINSTSKAVNK